MNEEQNDRLSDEPAGPSTAGPSGFATVLKALVIVLAVIGALAVLAAVGMGWMHFSMMDGMGKRCR